MLTGKKAQLTLQSSHSKTFFELLDGRTEELHFVQVQPTNFTVNDADFGMKSGLKVDLEIMDVELEATSSVLWPGQKVKVYGGVHGQGNPIQASVHIPMCKTIKDGVAGETFLFWRMVTPDGEYFNKKPIVMKGVLKSLPPRDVEFTSEGVIPFFDESDRQVGTIYGCCQSN